MVILSRTSLCIYCFKTFDSAAMPFLTIPLCENSRLERIEGRDVLDVYWGYKDTYRISIRFDSAGMLGDWISGIQALQKEITSSKDQVLRQVTIKHESSGTKQESKEQEMVGDDSFSSLGIPQSPQSLADTQSIYDVSEELNEPARVSITHEFLTKLCGLSIETARQSVF